MNISEIKDKLNLYLEEGLKDEAVQLLNDHAEENGYKKTINDILQPQLVEWGNKWMKGNLSLAHGYLSGKIAEEFFIKLKESEFTDQDESARGTIVIGNIEDDFHPLGRQLVRIFSESSGWKMIDLGTDVTAEEFIGAALEHNASIIAASAMMYTTAKNIKKIRTQLNNRGLSQKIKLAAGGAVFNLNKDLVKEVEADGTAPNAIDAPILFNQLQEQLNKA